MYVCMYVCLISELRIYNRYHEVEKKVGVQQVLIYYKFSLQSYATRKSPICSFQLFSNWWKLWIVTMDIFTCKLIGSINFACSFLHTSKVLAIE